MQRIPTLLKKVIELAEKGDKNTVIDIDLMLDYTRVVYADLLEWRNRKSFVASLPVNEEAPAIQEEYDDEGVAAPVQEEREEQKEPGHVNANNSSKTPVIEFIVNEAPAKPAADIRQSIGINDKYLFMSELFGNNKEEYERVLDKINTFSSYNEAEIWLTVNINPLNEENDTLEIFRGVLDVCFNAK
jgi:hypothetical protein